MRALRAPALTGAAAARGCVRRQSALALPPLQCAACCAPLAPHRPHLPAVPQRLRAAPPPLHAVVPRQRSRRGLCAARAAAGAAKPQRNKFNGVFTLILINVVLFVADHLLHWPAVSQLLYLHHARPHWWQFLTCAFCHGGWEHLSSNLFFLLQFGKSVEEEEGALGVWAAYALCGAGASLASYLLLPATSGGASVVSLGASGAVFGLFTVSLLVKGLNSWDWRKLLETAILGDFVFQRVWSEISVTTRGGGVGASGVNHVAHLAGALCGVLLILAVTRLLPAERGGDGEGDAGGGGGGGGARRIKS